MHREREREKRDEPSDPCDVGGPATRAERLDAALSERHGGGETSTVRVGECLGVVLAHWQVGLRCVS